MDLPERFEFHGPVCATVHEAINAWANMCIQYGILVCGWSMVAEYPDGLSWGHRMTSE